MQEQYTTQFKANNQALLQLINEWEIKLLSLSDDILFARKNKQHRTIKQIVGHMIDSASNNTHRIVHLQYQPSPLVFPDYASFGNNDRWISIQDYQSENWTDLVMLWKYANKHIAHVIEHVNPDKLNHEWLAGSGEYISLHAMITDYLRHFKLHVAEMDDLIMGNESFHG